MSRLQSILAMTVVALTAAGPGWADRALVIGAPEPERRGLLRGSETPGTAEALRDAGFEVITADAGSVRKMRAALSAFMKDLDEQERVLVHLSGGFVRGSGRNWLLETGLEQMPDLARVDDVALSLESVLSVAGRVQGRSVVALGFDEKTVSSGDGLKTGISVERLPQGVTMVRGGEAAIARFVASELLQEGRSLPEAIAASKGVKGRGFLSDQVAYLPLGAERPAAPPNAAEVERAIWQATQAQDSAEAFEGYLDRYPEGFFVAEARAAIERIRSEPNRDARLAEEALEMDRPARRTVQRQLTLLGFSPRGVDGVFGPGSRAAIVRFQTKNGFPGTGFLNAQQIERLEFQATARQAELAAEERRAKLAVEKTDRDAWAALNEGADEAGLRTYLDRFPEGLYAPIARERLEQIEADTQAAAAALERSDWVRASEAGTAAAYSAYLETHPKGAHADEARTRFEALDGAGSEALKAAREAEAALNLTPVTRMLVERRLEQLGHEPGAVDGRFDGDTRAAIGRFQRAERIEVTGYMSPEAAARMLADLGALFAPGR